MFNSILDKIGLNSQENKLISTLAIDIVLDSVSIVDTITNFLIKTGIIFIPFLRQLIIFLI